MRLYVLLGCVLVLGLPHFQSAAIDKIIMWDKSYHRPAMLELVTLSAELTKDEYGPYEIEPSIEMEEGRAFAQLIKDQDVNLAIGGVTKERERSARPIYFPLTRGLLGFRLCLVNKTHSDVFATITSLQDIQKSKIIIGLGAHWPDKNIIQENNLQVVTNPSFSRLFGMLTKNRFDCFLRGIGELEYELQAYATEELMIEEYVAFVYPLANFMFVSPSNNRLQERLKKGLLLAKKNGLFKQHFNKHYRKLLYSHKFYERKLFFLENSNISEKAAEAINQFGIASFAN